MNLEIRISPDGRGKMRIVVERQSKVTKWSVRICCLCHFWQEKTRIFVEFLFIRDFFEEFSDMCWFESIFFFFLEKIQRDIFCENSLDNLSLLIAGESMDTREEGNTLFFTPFCYFLIGEYHEFFDELMSIIAFPFLY